MLTQRDSNHEVMASPEAEPYNEMSKRVFSLVMRLVVVCYWLLVIRDLRFEFCGSGLTVHVMFDLS